MHGDELRDFLRARRDLITPADVGLVVHGRRRVSGLRREEVAALAGVSTDYYTKFEQGKSSGVSDSVIDAVADVLRLDATERAHLHRLARVTSRRPRPRTPVRPVRPGVRRLLDLMSDVPAVVLGPRFDAMAWNGLADALFTISATVDNGQSHALQIFLDPAARVVYPQWESVAAEVVGFLRFSAGRDPNDAALGELVGELSASSAEFRSLWRQQRVQDKTHGRKLVEHPVVGLLELDFETFRLAEDGRQSLMTYAARPGSRSEERLRLLASWAAEPHRKAAPRPERRLPAT